MKEPLLKIRPELRHQITHNAARQTGRHAACHHRAANAYRRIIELEAAMPIAIPPIPDTLNAAAPESWRAITRRLTE